MFNKKTVTGKKHLKPKILKKREAPRKPSFESIFLIEIEGANFKEGYAKIVFFRLFSL